MNFTEKKAEVHSIQRLLLRGLIPRQLCIPFIAFNLKLVKNSFAKKQPIWGKLYDTSCGLSVRYIFLTECWLKYIYMVNPSRMRSLPTVNALFRSTTILWFLISCEPWLDRPGIRRLCGKANLSSLLCTQQKWSRWKTAYQESVFVSQPMDFHSETPRSRTRGPVDAEARFTPSNFIWSPCAVCFHHGLYVRKTDSQPYSINITFPRTCSLLSPLIISNMKDLHWPLCSQTCSATL